MERSGWEIAVAEKWRLKKFVAHGDVQMREIENFKRECFVMARLQKDGVSHPNIVQMLHCCWKSSLLLILDYYVLGSLREVLDVDIRMPNGTERSLCWIDSLSSQKGVLLTDCVEYMR